ncbi:MAG: hypothetical protein ABJE95_15700 [Byssovorax sp.]
MSEAGDRDRDLEDEARALLRPAREPQAVSAEARARMLRRLSLALPIGGGPGDPGSPAAPGHAGPAAANGLARALAARVPAWSALASFVVGGVIAAAVTRSTPPARIAIEIAPREATIAASATAPVAPPAPSTSAAPAIVAAPTIVVAPTGTTASSARPASSIASARAGSDGALEAERALLDVARTALGRGDGTNALRATEEHARKFPRGILAEEREAMSIQALRLLHRDDEAQARLERFRGRFPSSLIRPALEATEVADGGAL